MLVIGLTGGIGSGKSTVTKLFAAHGVPIIDADQISREITQPKQPALEIITSHFGPDILLKDGTLDRPKLRKIIFNHAEERLWLEKLLHPLIRQEIETRIQAHSAPYCITVIPLLFETMPYPFIDRILVIDISENQQVCRVSSRDNVPHAAIAPILKTQIKRKERLSKADDVINNAGTLATLIPQVEKLHQLYLSLAKSY